MLISYGFILCKHVLICNVFGNLVFDLKKNEYKCSQKIRFNWNNNNDEYSNHAMNEASTLNMSTFFFFFYFRMPANIMAITQLTVQPQKKNSKGK